MNATQSSSVKVVAREPWGWKCCLASPGNKPLSICKRIEMEMIISVVLEKKRAHNTRTNLKHQNLIHKLTRRAEHKHSFSSCMLYFSLYALTWKNFKWIEQLICEGIRTKRSNQLKMDEEMNVIGAKFLCTLLSVLFVELKTIKNRSELHNLNIVIT